MLVLLLAFADRGVNAVARFQSRIREPFPIIARRFQSSRSLFSTLQSCEESTCSPVGSIVASRCDAIECPVSVTYLRSGSWNSFSGVGTQMITASMRSMPETASSSDRNWRCHRSLIVGSARAGVSLPDAAISEVT